jgi:hypothetical protein
MKTPYEIWDNDTFNIIYAYPTSDEALASIRNEIAANGPDSASSWILQYDDRATAETVAYGESLVDLALKAAPVSNAR